MPRRKRKAREIAEGLITDRLEYLEFRMSKQKSMTMDEWEMLVGAYKALAETEHSDAEVDFLKALDTKQSDMLDEVIIDIERANAKEDGHAQNAG